MKRETGAPPDRVETIPLNSPPFEADAVSIHREPLQPVSPVVAHFLEYWRELARAAGGVPSRAQVDPADLVACLPHCWLYQQLPGEEDYRCVLSGEAVNTAWGRNIMGLRTDQFIASGEIDYVRARWRFLHERCLVAYCNHDGRGRSKSVERLVTPLLSRSGEPDMVFGVSIHRFDPLTEADMATSPLSLEYLYFDPLAD